MTTSSRPQRLRLMEAYRNLFYTPIYVAVAGGFLYQEGLDVLFSTVPPGKSSIDLLKSGEADIIQTGISRSFMDMDEGQEDAPLHIAEINQHDGFFLVSQHPTDNWNWTDLEGASLIPIGFTPVPLTSLKEILRKHSVDINRIHLFEGLSAQDAIQKFSNGEADYIHMVNPQAQQLINDGAGYLAAALGPELDYICYSSFAVTPQFLESNPDIVQKFVRGFYQAQQWLSANDAKAVADRISPFFPDTSIEVLEQSIQRYKSQDTWAKDPFIGEDGFYAMQDILIKGGVVKNQYSYERVVRPEFATEAMST